jgi:PDZ domain-containing protein
MPKLVARLRIMKTYESGEPSAHSMVVASPLAWQALPAHPRQAWRWALAAIVVAAAVLVASLTITLPYYIESPGLAQSIKPLIQVDPAHRHPVQGDVLLSTVALQSSVHPIDLAASWFDSNEHVVARQDVTGGQSPQQFNLQSVQDMSQSETEAIVVGLRRLGYHVPETGDGVLVVGIDPRAAAVGHMAPGDVIFGADGKPVSIVSDLTKIILGHKPGQQLALKVEDTSGARHDLAVSLIACPEDICPGTHGTRPYLGVELQTRHDKFLYPFKISIDLNNVGGPSAGLAFALGVVDTLSTGNITGGKKVAVTGTISPDGSVGPIGGIALKTVAVENAGADVFLVPKDVAGTEPQYSAAAAKARGHHLKVIAVGSLEDALNALRSLGGNLSGIGPPPAQLDG